MMTVRFPNGQAIQYNNAHFLLHTESGDWTLSEKEDGKKIVFIQASAGVIVEFVSPCSVYNAIQKIDNQDLILLKKEIQSLKRKIEKGAKK